MKAGPVIVGQLLQNRNRYCVPIYQRHYVWNKQKQWEPFWNDIRSKAIERLGGKERRFSHYMGAVVLEARGGFSARRVPSYQVVDGQQRLTTFQLFLAAARDYAASIGHKSAEETISTYLLNRDPHLMEEPEIEIFKVWPTQYDREMFMDILNLGGREALRKKYSEHFYKGKKRDQIYEYSTSPRLLVGYGYFYERIRHAVESDDLDDEFIETPDTDNEENESPASGNDIPRELRLDAIWQSLVEEFKVVEIVLEEGDDAQVIFETLIDDAERRRIFGFAAQVGTQRHNTMPAVRSHMVVPAASAQAVANLRVRIAALLPRIGRYIDFPFHTTFGKKCFEDVELLRANVAVELTIIDVAVITCHFAPPSIERRLLHQSARGDHSGG